jgi:2-oxoisovalerate dehydrogenase E2 component (dihydrolipoyl transacylase)
MGTYRFKLPDVGEGTAEAEIVAWHVSPGQMVTEDDPLVDVMTDKATVEMTAPVSGKILETVGAPGDMAPVGAVIVVFETEGGDDAEPAPARTPIAAAADTPPPAPPKQPEPPPAHAPAPKAAPTPPPKAQSDLEATVRREAAPRRPDGERPLASPAVRRRAETLGVRLSYVTGGGPGGRIEHADLDAYLAAEAGPAPAAPSGRASPRLDVEEIKVIGLRRKIAEKMQEAKRRIPHFAYIEEVDMTDLEALRTHLNATHPERGKLTVLPFFARAIVSALAGFPQINARYDDDAGIVRRYGAVHLGVATQTPGGLIVPVVRHAETLSLWETSAEVARLAAAARNGKARSEELSGSTITLTSLGPLGGIATTPVINHPEVAIIGPNKIVERPVVRNGRVEVRKMMNISSSFDHRVVDGYDAALFVQRIKGLLEHPAALFVE